MTEKANKNPKSIRGNENGSQRISKQTHMKLYSSNTKKQTMKEWFQHFGNTISNIEFYTYQTKFYTRVFSVLSHLPPVLLALSTHVTSEIQHTVFDHQKTSSARPWCHRKKEPQSRRILQLPNCTELAFHFVYMSKMLTDSLFKPFLFWCLL